MSVLVILAVGFLLLLYLVAGLWQRVDHIERYLTTVAREIEELAEAFEE